MTKPISSMVFNSLDHAEYSSLVDLVTTDQFRVVRFTPSRRETSDKSDWYSTTETYEQRDNLSCVDIFPEKVAIGAPPSYEKVHINFYDLGTIFGASDIKYLDPNKQNENLKPQQ